MDNHKSLLAVYNNPAFSEFKKPCDAKLKTDDGTEFQVYKEPLSSQPFFKAIFSFDGTLGKTSVIPGIQPDILEVILIYCYTGFISLNTENIMRLYVASDFLSIESLKRECKMFVLQNMTYKNCVDLFLTANIINGLDLENECQRFLLICFEKAVKHSKNKAYDLSYNSIISFLSSKSVNASGERSIWSFIEAWVLKDPTDRMIHVPELLRCLSLNEIDKELASDIISSPIIRENELYETIRGKCKRKISSYCNGVPFTNGVRLPPRLYLVTKGFSDRSGADLFISYDENLDVWRKLGKTIKPLKIVRVDHRVYLIKSWGERGASVYDLLTGNFEPLMGPTLYEDSHYVEASGYIYAVSGSNVYRYVYGAHRWFAGSSMHQRMFVTGVVSLNGLIYAIGKIQQEGIVQVYEPSSDSWGFAAPPPNINALFTKPVVYREKIFLIDWTDVEVYDPVQNEWEVYPKLPFEYRAYWDDAAIVKGRLYLYKKVITSKTVLEQDRAFVVYWDGSGEWKIAKDQSCLMNTSICTIEGEGVVREVMMKNKAACTQKWKVTHLEDAMSLTTEVTEYSRGEILRCT